MHRLRSWQCSSESTSTVGLMQKSAAYRHLPQTGQSLTHYPVLNFKSQVGCGLCSHAGNFSICTTEAHQSLCWKWDPSTFIVVTSKWWEINREYCHGPARWIWNLFLCAQKASHHQYEHIIMKREMWEMKQNSLMHLSSLLGMTDSQYGPKSLAGGILKKSLWSTELAKK